MSQLIVQNYKLSRTALKTKARVVKVNRHLLHIVYKYTRAEFLTGIQATVWHPRVVRGAMHSGKKWRSALWINAMNSYSLLYILFKSLLCCSPLATLAPQQKAYTKRVKNNDALIDKVKAHFTLTIELVSIRPALNVAFYMQLILLTN